MRENLTIAQLKLVASSITDPESDDLKFFGSTVAPSDFSSWRLGFSIKIMNFYFILMVKN
jgi:hypothetical protein